MILATERLHGLNGLACSLLRKLLCHVHQGVMDVRSLFILNVLRNKLAEHCSEGRVFTKVLVKGCKGHFQQGVLLNLYIKLSGKTQFNSKCSDEPVCELI